MSTGWTINGLDLRRVGYNIITTSGWDGMPGTKIPRFSYGFRHGDRLGNKGFYQPKPLSIAMVILPTAADGTQTLQPEAHIQENIDTLLGALHSPDRLVTVQRTFGAGATVRETQASVLNAFPINTGRGGVHARSMIINMEMTYPLWHELPQVNLVSASSLTNDGNAPIGDAILTCTAAGRLTVDSSGDWVEVSSTAGGNVVIDVGAGTILQGGVDADNLVTQGQTWLPEFEPGVNALTITGTWNIDYYHTYF